MQAEIHAVTRELRAAAVDLLVRFFREEGFMTPPPRIAENLDRMLSDSSCWCALAVADGEARAVITVSTVLYVEWGRLGEIGDLYVLPEYRRRGLATVETIRLCRGSAIVAQVEQLSRIERRRQ